MASANSKQKQRKLRGRISLALKILCGVGVVAALTMGATVFFRVENIAVTGNNRYTQEEIVAASGIRMGDNLFHMNKFQIEGELRHGLPYLEEVVINRQLPNGVCIEVQEWDAIAQLLPTPGAEPSAPAKDLEQEIVAPPDPAASEEDSSAEEDKKKPSGDKSPEVPEEEVLLPAEEPWLISVGGKLLEPAPGNCSAMLVNGLTALAPEAGTMVRVPEEEKLQLSGLVNLLHTLEQTGKLDRVSAVDVEETTLTFSYLNRFDVKLPLNADFKYKLDFLEEMVKRLNEKHGEECKGKIDLSREDYGGSYLPEN